MEALRSVAALTVAGSIGFGLFPALHDGALHPDALEILRHMSIVFLDDGQGGLVKTIRFTGVNVQIVNGLGATNGDPSDPFSSINAETNGHGNLIVGYNESFGAASRTGSHCIVGGIDNDFTNYGGIVFGPSNQVTREHSCTLGGFGNSVSASLSLALGGRQNQVGAGSSVAVAGNDNQVSGFYSAAVGGENCKAYGEGAVTIGGRSSLADDYWSTVTGGFLGQALAPYAAVSGGVNNVAQGDYSVVSGGADRSVSGESDWAAGSLFEDD